MFVNMSNIDTLVNKSGNVAVDFSCLSKEFITKCYQIEDYALVFECASGNVYCLYHFQDCCESVYISDICGDLSDLTGQTVRAEVTTGELDEYGMWTFYKIDTAKGGVTIRWNGESEYYSVEVVCLKLDCAELILKSKINHF